MEVKDFEIFVEYSVWGKVNVKATSLEEALKKAKENIDDLPLPDEPEYIEGSFVIDEETTKQNN